tara:strand:- start:66 stop:302 length:237 start_codon:yes stop_codon:yes gene_type:complete
VEIIQQTRQMKSVIILLVAAHLEFTVDTPLQRYQITYKNNFDCFDKIDEIREKIAVYHDNINKWLLKDGRQFVGGYCQ